MKKLIKNKETSDIRSKLIILCVGAFIIRIILGFIGTVSIDQNTFIAWGHQLVTGGFKTFYTGWSDYLPGYLYILALLAKIESIVPLSSVLLYKLPAICFDLASGLLVYKIIKPYGERKALLGAALILLNPAVLSNSTLWGQVDSISFFFPLLSVYLFPSAFFASAISLGLGALIKPQAALAAIAILYLFREQRTPLHKILFYVFLSAVTFLAGFIPFFSGSNIISFAWERLQVTLNQYPYTSINAFNFWALWGFWQKESLGVFSEKNIGFIFFSIVSLLGYLRFPKKEKQYWILFILFASNFLFFTRMHERHFLAAVMSLSVLVPMYPALLLPAAIISLTYIANMYYSYVWITDDFREVFSSVMIGIFIFGNLLSVALVFLYKPLTKLIKNISAFFTKKTVIRESIMFVQHFYNNKDEILPTTLNKKNKKIILTGILAFALLSRLVGLGSPDHEYFDEVYHAFTAKVMLHNDPKAWEWWNPNPDGFAYEWTHPPVAKEVMALSMRVLGESSFAYRIPAALFGVGVVFLIYKVASEFFNEEVGLLSAAAFSLDGLGLVMSRIGMNDIYVVFFMLLTVLLILKNRNFLGGLSLGLAAASKWTTLWLLPVLGVLFFLNKKKLKINHIWLVVLPPLVYVATYLPQFLSGHDWTIFWGMQKQMWWYHTQLVATHPYTSRWWTWPLLLRPIWLYTSGDINGQVANIYGMGNPLIFWGGLVAGIMSIGYIFTEKRKRLLIILAAYLGLFTPWSLSPRIMFFYHYFPAVPFLCMLIGFVLYKNKRLIFPFFILTLVLYIYFYPHWTGISVPVWLDNSYYWLPGWR